MNRLRGHIPLLIIVTGVVASHIWTSRILTIFEDTAIAQQAVISVLNAEIKESNLRLSKNEIRTRLETLFPNKSVIESDNTLTINGAVFRFENNEYTGSNP